LDAGLPDAGTVPCPLVSGHRTRGSKVSLCVLSVDPGRVADRLPTTA
jgi:hypothetical protein